MTTVRSLDQASLRVMPHNIDAEQALLGAVLVNNDAFRKVSTIVSEEHFFEQVHQRIWHVAATLIEKGQIASPITMKAYLGDGDMGVQMTPGQYMARLATQATTVINAPEYAKTVRDLHRRRRIISVAQEAVDLAYDCPVETSVEQLFSELERGLDAERPLMTGEYTDFCEFGRITSEEVYDAYERQAGVVGLSTGLPRLDEVLGGLQASDLIIIAGRPGTGKTSLATNIALSVARHVMQRREAGERLGVVGFSSLEMGAKQLKQRILSDLANVPFWKLQRGVAGSTDMERYIDAERAFQRLPLLIDPTGGLSIAQIKMRARSLKKRHGLSLLVIDYLQLLSGSKAGGRDVRRVDEVTEITTNLKALAKELDIPIIALSQLSRKVEERDDKRPMLSDLRESGSIEQDADSVVFVYREEYYLKKAEPREKGSEAYARWMSQMRRWTGVAEAIVSKNRHGGEGVVELGFQGEFTRFTNEPEEREEEPEVVRERRKAYVPTAQGTILHGVLKSLSITRSTAPTREQLDADRKLKRSAKLIDPDEAKAAFGREIGEADSAAIEKLFRPAFISLRKGELALFTGAPEPGFRIWVPELCSD